MRLNEGKIENQDQRKVNHIYALEKGYHDILRLRFKLASTK